MPVIHTYVSTPITDEQREQLKTIFGEAIEAIPGKSEKWLMCLFEDGLPIYHAGNGADPAAFLDVSLYATEPIARECWEDLTKRLMAATSEVLGIDKARTYIQYSTSPNFGWNDINF